MSEFWCVNADVTINDKDGIGMIGANHILIMHVTQVNFWGGISPVSRVLEFKSHLSHKCCDFFVTNWLPVDERLLNNNFEFSSLVTSKTQYKETRLGEIGVVESYSIKGKNWLNKVIKTYRLDECGAMVINDSFTAFGNLFPKAL